jgi:hypothetical protein
MKTHAIKTKTGTILPCFKKTPPQNVEHLKAFGVKITPVLQLAKQSKASNMQSQAVN